MDVVHTLWRVDSNLLRMSVEDFTSFDLSSYPSMPAVPPEEWAEVAELEQGARVGRLRKIGVSLLAGLAVAVAPAEGLLEAVHLDTQIETAIDHKPVHFDVIDNSAETLLPNTITMVIPGFNVGETDPIAEELSPILKNYGGVVAANVGSQPFDFDEFADKTIAYAKDRKITTMNLYGHSMGGTIAVALAARLEQAGIHVPIIFANSSPSDVNDVQGWSNLIDSPLPDWLFDYGLSGGYITRTGINEFNTEKGRFQNFVDTEVSLLATAGQPKETGSRKGLKFARLPNDVRIGQIWQRSFAGASHDFAHAWRDATSPSHLPNEECLSQLRFLSNYPISRSAADLSPYTQVVFIGSTLSEDGTVEVTSAAQGYEKTFGGNVVVVRLPELRHADLNRHPKLAERVLGDAAKAAGISDVRNMGTDSTFYASGHH